jgi:predicted dehydrogenase
MTTGIAIVGCGYAADFYMMNLQNYPQLYLIGAYDRDIDRLNAFCNHYGTRPFTSLADLLSDIDVEVILNLTNPSQHHRVSLAALEAGRHVYSEKPFALDLDEGRHLIEVARRNGFQLASAPCTLLGEPAQTAWAALRRGEIGRPLLIFAELNEGMAHKMLHSRWISPSGAVWPFQDEFQTGCALEHGSYVLTWLTAFFGRIESVTANTFVLAEDKHASEKLGPDFSCAVLRFANGVVARITLSIIAPVDHGLTIVGEDGVLEVADVWDFDSPVSIRRPEEPDASDPSRYLKDKTNYPLLRGPERPFRYHDSHNMDMMRGVAELAHAISLGQQSRLSGDRALHILEATLAMSDTQGETCHQMETPFEPVEPMPWAQ